jgi:hypothetical protein
VKVVRYIDVYPGMSPENAYFSRADTAGELSKGWKRFKVTVEIPEVELQHDGIVPSVVEECD